MTADVTPCQNCGRLVYSKPVITIPTAIYEDLVKRAGKLQPLASFKSSRSPLARDTEVGDFLIAVASEEVLTIAELRQRCLARFGDARTPSRSAIHRYVQAAARGHRPGPVMERRI